MTPETSSADTTAQAPWQSNDTAAYAPTQQRFDWGKALPLVGPVVLLLIWDLVVRFGLIKPILLPAPIDTLLTLINGMAGPVLLPHFWVTLERTLYAFAIATAVGMPLGIALGSNERAYRSVEFVIDFFRSTHTGFSTHPAFFADFWHQQHQ